MLLYLENNVNCPPENDCNRKDHHKNHLENKTGSKMKTKNYTNNRGHETFPKDLQRQTAYLPSEEIVYINVKMCTLQNIHPTLDLF